MCIRDRSWLIRHLKKAGVPDRDLIKIYIAIVRSVIEYAVPAYHSLLTSNQADELERLQRTILKIIYGWNISYTDALVKSGLSTLEERRASLMEKFARKLEANKRYEDWIPKHSDYSYPIRRKLIYQEERARTEKMRNSPLFAIRKILNS